MHCMIRQETDECIPLLDPKILIINMKIMRRLKNVKLVNEMRENIVCEIQTK